MGTVATITINDGAGAPVARSFVPGRRDGDSVAYVEKSSGIVVSYRKIVLATKLPNVNSTGEKNFKIRFSVHVPIAEVLPDNPALNKLAYTCRFQGEFVIPERSVLQDRQHVRAFVKNLLTHSVITDLVESLDSQV